MTTSTITFEETNPFNDPYSTDDDNDIKPQELFPGKDKNFFQILFDTIRDGGFCNVQNKQSRKKLDEVGKIPPSSPAGETVSCDTSCDDDDFSPIEQEVYAKRTINFDDLVEPLIIPDQEDTVDQGKFEEESQVPVAVELLESLPIIPEEEEVSLGSSLILSSIVTIVTVALVATVSYQAYINSDFIMCLVESHISDKHFTMVSSLTISNAKNHVETVLVPEMISHPGMISLAVALILGVISRIPISTKNLVRAIELIWNTLVCTVISFAIYYTYKN